MGYVVITTDEYKELLLKANDYDRLTRWKHFNGWKEKISGWR